MNPVIIGAKSKHTATLIFLHGLGDTGHGWASTVGAIKGSHVKVICPTAPTMPVTLNSGFRMPSWFDLRSLDASGPEDEEGIKKATESIHQLIDSEIKAGIDPSRVVLGGFSQGGALAIYSALLYPKTLGGIVGLSCWLPLHKSFPEAAQLSFNKDTPLLQCHGDCDPLVPYRWAQMTASLLKQFASKAEFKSYKGLEHTSSDEELEDIKKFLARIIPQI